MWHLGSLVALAVLGEWLDSLIQEVFSSHNGSMTDSAIGAGSCTGISVLTLSPNFSKGLRYRAALLGCCGCSTKLEKGFLLGF